MGVEFVDVGAAEKAWLEKTVGKIAARPVKPATSEHRTHASRRPQRDGRSWR